MRQFRSIVRLTGLVVALAAVALSPARDSARAAGGSAPTLGPVFVIADHAIDS
ncbi:MAG: hypothetical protein OES32_01215 [Acidobacteriota bacterium]|nr:hypothetical protein [Acidobacteriota bacterium]